MTLVFIIITLYTIVNNITEFLTLLAQCLVIYCLVHGNNKLMVFLILTQELKQQLQIDWRR